MREIAGLDVTALVAGYGSRPLARLPALSVAPGAAALLLGPSGSGKTTLLLALAGLARTLAGTIAVAGTEVQALAARARDRHRGRSIGLVFQDFHLIGGLSALDNLLLAPFAAGTPQDRAQACALLDDLGVGGRVDARASTLSRGEAQRVAIARALLQRPKLLLADEPTASLDDAAAATVLSLLTGAAAASGAALVIATHDTRLKSAIAHQVFAEPVV
ncbi:ATP-binding cassette domain-containing protein (plasmid) [Polymorphobacter sp. PAMC 29334]|uniref:ABC transporter ATP-binding protein n=1 Tax=Polymorphobacter sp. PAMC 29334 TaxID=2862331 RepID=UPI001C76E9B5|nr:ATP-binding cassette domain-containing protein [Polymorphobacter sp. PAMC 29334]QYE37271.1 ATP-binding cassette domain-containing protein [Polymorphobacter sp. PAMC 29334]